MHCKRVIACVAEVISARINTDCKAFPAILTGISVRFLGVLHCGNIEYNMIPIALFKMIAIRASGFYPNPVSFASDNNTIIH